jgi:hypothetical protein
VQPDPSSASRAISVERDVAIVGGKTLPLANPMKLAVGAVAPSSGPDPLNQTLPMSNRPRAAPFSSPSRALDPSSAPSSGSLPSSPTSGVYSSRPAAHSGAPSAGPPVSGRTPARRTFPMWVLFAVFIVIAVLAGALAAWFVR